MVGDQKLFHEALKRGSALAWSGRWAESAAEYRLALAQFPDDLSARSYLAMALHKSGQLEEALELYEGLWRAQPSNLATLRRVAELQEALGRCESAADSFRILAEMYTSRGADTDALHAWRKVVELKPGDPTLWRMLMEAAVRARAVGEVMPAYLGFARDLAVAGRFQEAIAAAETAQKLDPGNPSVPTLVLALRRALECTWRAAAVGEQLSRDELARLIPPVPPSATPEELEAGGQPCPDHEGQAAPGAEAEALGGPEGGEPPRAEESIGLAASQQVVEAQETPDGASDVERVEIPEDILAVTEATEAATLRDEASRPDVDRAMPMQIETVEQQGLEVGRDEALAELDSLPIAMGAGDQEPEAVVDGCDDAGDAVQTLEASVAGELTGGGADEQLNRPRVLLEVARQHLAADQLDDAEEKARCILEILPCDEETSLAAAELLLQLCREKASRGDLLGAAERLGWLRGKMLGGFLPASATQRLVDVAVELLGRCAGEHLEELTSLPSVARGEVLLAVRRAERLLGAGKLRSAADELFRVVSRHPDFLPAHSMLGRVLAAQGRTEEARARSERLLGLYELRAASDQALEVLWWSAGQGIGGEGSNARLGELLRAQGRIREAELLELGLLGSGLWDSEPLALEMVSWPNSAEEVLLPDSEPEVDELSDERGGGGRGNGTARFARSPDPRTLLLAVQGSLKPGRDAGCGLPAEATPGREEVAPDQDSCGLGDASEAEEPQEVGVGDAGEGTTRLGEEPAEAQQHGQETGAGRSPWDELLAVAESQFAQGDRSGAAALLALAVESQSGVGLEDRAALIRALQMIAPEDKLVSELPGLLARLGLPEELAQ